MTSQYYCVLQSLHKATSQYYFVLHSLHQVLPSTTLHYTACTKHFQVLLCATKLAQTTSQYYCILQSLHKALPSTTLYYKACTKHFQYYCVPQSLHKKNQRPETRHVGAAKPAFRARHPPILTLLARYQTGWNVTKCHACHTKRHDNLLGNLRKGEVLQLPP